MTNDFATVRAGLGVTASTKSRMKALAALERIEAALKANDWELADYAKTVGNLRAELDDAKKALAVCRESLTEQAAARADPTMPRLTKEVLAKLRDDAKASYACAETREERVLAHGLSLLCDWQTAAARFAETAEGEGR